MSEAQSTCDVLMVRPARFMGNEQTAPSNRFQQCPDTCLSDSQPAALREFEGLANTLAQAGIRVYSFDDTLEPHTPDSLFPNNWVSFHADGTAVLYPMLAPNRRLERRMDILETLSSKHGFSIRRVIDLSHHEAAGRYLEGTGSLVLDRIHRVAYACLSPRTHPGVLEEFSQKLGYEPVPFTATDDLGVPIYHTNVMLCVGSKFAAICSAAIATADRDAVLDRLQSTGHEVLDLSLLQMAAFAGNMLEVGGGEVPARVLLSSAALNVLAPAQLDVLQRLQLPPLAAAIPTIEKLGGGSVRCMVAEIHLPRV